MAAAGESDRDNRTLHFYRLSRRTNDGDFLRALSAYGAKHAYVTKENGASCRSGFATFDSVENAERVRCQSSMVIDGVTAEIERTNERRPRVRPPPKRQESPLPRAQKKRRRRTLLRAANSSSEASAPAVFCDSPMQVDATSVGARHKPLPAPLTQSEGSPIPVSANVLLALGGVGATRQDNTCPARQVSMRQYPQVDQRKARPNPEAPSTDRNPSARPLDSRCSGYPESMRDLIAEVNRLRGSRLNHDQSASRLH